MTDEDTYPNAGRPSGYVDEGGNPVSESLVNVITRLVSSIETKILTNHIATQQQIGTVAKAFEPVARGQIDVASKVHALERGIRKELDARFKGFEAVQDKHQREVMIEVRKIQTDVDALRQGYSNNAARIAALEEHARGSRRAELDAIHEWQQRVDRDLAEIKRIDRELAEIKRLTERGDDGER